MSQTPRLVQRLGLAIVAAGLVAGTAVYLAAGAASDDDIPGERGEMSQLARLGGTATVQTVKFDRWLDSLWHGQRLGETLAVLGLLVGGACWRVGVLMAEEDLPD